MGKGHYGSDGYYLFSFCIVYIIAVVTQSSFSFLNVKRSKSFCNRILQTKANQGVFYSGTNRVRSPITACQRKLSFDSGLK